MDFFASSSCLVGIRVITGGLNITLSAFRLMNSFGGPGADLPEANYRRKVCRREEDGEDEALKGYKEMRNKLNKNLDAAMAKLSEFLSTQDLHERREGVEYLKDRLESLKPDVWLEPIYIGVFGSTGAGKSTLLNAIIHKQFFLPVSGNQSCTSCVVQINTADSVHHEAKIYLLTYEEWKEELKDLVALADKEEDEESNERYEAVLKISTIYGEGAETKSYEELCRMKPLIPIPSQGCISFKERNEKELSKKMNPYIRAQSIHHEAEEGAGEENKIKVPWPLLRNVEVTIPRLQELPEGVILVDIPGMGDFNRKRDTMWKENINKCSVIWVVNAMERIQGDRTHEMVLKEGMKAFRCGMCKDISLVVTKADDMDINEYRRETNNNHINKHDAILERNQNVKKKKKIVMKKNLEKNLPRDSEVLQKDDLIYTVSSREYWNGETLSRAETEIPKLREYIQAFSRAQRRNKLMEHVKEALGTFSLIRSLQSNRDPQHDTYTRNCCPKALPWAQLDCISYSFTCQKPLLVAQGDQFHPSQEARENELKVLIQQKINELDKDIKKCFEPLEQHLQEGVGQAKKLCKKNTDKVLQQSRGGQGFHKTLKALCVKNGEYTSRTFGRIDMNMCLAQPIYDKIDMSFGNIFRIQMGTRTTLTSCLAMAKEDTKRQVQEAMKNYPVMETLSFLQQEIDFIFRKTEKLILQKKGKIYQSLTISIQNNLLPHYEAAASQRGAQALARMKNILSEGVRTEQENRMFEKAQESMKSHFQDLKMEIIKQMRQDFSNVLSLTFCPWEKLQEKLPDFSSEFSSICKIHQDLQSIGEA
ncbi:nuclear GTPase SLIP-GC [Phaethornis superciliosus]